MSDSGREQVDTIHRDIGCPKCNYNLRGLSGESIACPECGARWLTSRIKLERWMRRRDRLPGLIEARAMPATAICGFYIMVVAFMLFWDEYLSTWAPAGGPGYMARGRLTRDFIIGGWVAFLTVGGLLLMAFPVLAIRISSREIGARLARRVALLAVIEYVVVIPGLVASFQVANVGIAILNKLRWPYWNPTALDVLVLDQFLPLSVAAAVSVFIAIFTLGHTRRGLRTTLIAGLTAAETHRAHLQP